MHDSSRRLRAGWSNSHEIRDKAMQWLLVTECKRREWILGTRAQRSRNLYLVLYYLITRAILHTEAIYYKLSIWVEIIGV